MAEEQGTESEQQGEHKAESRRLGPAAAAGDDRMSGTRRWQPLRWQQSIQQSLPTLEIERGASGADQAGVLVNKFPDCNQAVVTSRVAAWWPTR